MCGGTAISEMDIRIIKEELGLIRKLLQAHVLREFTYTQQADEIITKLVKEEAIKNMEAKR